MKVEVYWPYWSVVVEAAEKIKKACMKGNGHFKVDGITCQQDHEEFTLDLSSLNIAVQKAVVVYDFCMGNNPKDFLSVRVVFKDGMIWDVCKGHVGMVFVANDKNGDDGKSDKEVVFRISWVTMKYNPTLTGELSSISVDFIDQDDRLIVPHVFALNPKSRKCVIGFTNILAKEFGFDFQERIDSDKKVSQLLELSHIFDVVEQL